MIAVTGWMLGTTPVEDIEWSTDSKTLSWKRPSFYSDDVPQGSFFTYNIIVNDISIINTTDTSVWLNISSCDIHFNVTVITSIYQYKAELGKMIPNIVDTSKTIVIF